MEPTAGVKHKVLQGGKFAVFTHKGSYETLNDSYHYIMGQWLPESGFEIRDVEGFELYLNRDPSRTKPENLRTDIYIPIQSK